MKILVVDNDPSRAKTLVMVLSCNGFNTYVTDLVDEAIELLTLYDYDAVLLNMAVHGATKIITSRRSSGINVPILCAVEVMSPEKTAELLIDGADDVVGTPFHWGELSARLLARIRRSHGHVDSIVKVGDVSVNLAEKTVTVQTNHVHLTEKEYGIVELLALRKGHTVTKDSLLNHLYGGMDEPKAKILDVFVCRLRKKLSEAGAGGVITNVRGRGYILRA